MPPPVALILGSGARIGASVSSTLSAQGYKIATVSRKGTGSKTSDGYLSLKADFSQPTTIPAVFEAVKAEFNTAPSVVVYNAASLTPPPEEDNVLSVPIDAVLADLNINTISPYLAAQLAVEGWKTLPASTKKTFIFTGNALNTTVMPMAMFVDLAMGKSASAAWIGLADTLHKDARFHYADQRQPDGGGSFNLDGPAHGEFYAKLARQEEELPWHVTFVKDKGYVQFKS